ncbi:peptide/nickel transport system ATP-binding protein [Peptoclostridium litorale DSM 5388]|uniref:Oligopeptide transport ATP-binding protein AppD n=2 Tax=Peptoclostridium litorale TaxID=1557 RepID=A0A069RGE2_PEPLI|nr:ABC transporter ATP-binding protein [Peptoclostridium litorale]KDR95878.1 oligopeptide transport ATP-binding protein AppD [Peptoclostridium litorale DSM 5388]SIO10833.1 peptide/nickel transport system ATP-binding protein [Peptoclostridium litorale DSM 5388]
MEKLLDVKDLRTYFYTSEGKVPAVDGVSFSVGKGETVAIVGESGSGKSITALSILGCVPSPPGRIESGEIVFEGKNLLEKSKKDMRKIRGNEISMIFQEPMTSLNPVYTVGRQLSEVFEIHHGMNRKEGFKKAEELLEMVGIPSPQERVKQYPHQMSGGMRQRVMIAMALACNPKLIIADEPTTALDVTIQAQILELMKDMKRETKASILIITHDLGVVAEMAERVIVMYAGKVIESATVREIFKNPKHPYTMGLLSSMPSMDAKRERLTTIEGSVPRPTEFPKGCRFNPRCNFAREVCQNYEPPLRDAGERCISCWMGTQEYLEEVTA